MTGEQLIEQIQDQAGEWIETVDCPATFVAGVLANKVIELQKEVDYLKLRLRYATINR